MNGIKAFNRRFIWYSIKKDKKIKASLLCKGKALSGTSDRWSCFGDSARCMICSVVLGTRPRVNINSIDAKR